MIHSFSGPFVEYLNAVVTPKWSKIVLPVTKHTILTLFQAILLNGWILSTGGLASGKVCVCSLHSRLVFFCKQFLSWHMEYIAVRFSVYCFYHGIGDMLQFCFLYAVSIMAQGIRCSSIFVYHFYHYIWGMLQFRFLFSVSFMTQVICYSSVFCLPLLSWHMLQFCFFWYTVSSMAQGICCSSAFCTQFLSWHMG